MVHFSRSQFEYLENKINPIYGNTLPVLIQEVQMGERIDSAMHIAKRILTDEMYEKKVTNCSLGMLASKKVLRSHFPPWKCSKKHEAFL